MKKTEIVKGITEKKQKSKELYGTRGITLVALVITIIIIIILASITMNMVFGENGIVENVEIIPMKMIDEDEENKKYTFSAKIELKTGGNYGYTFRVMPKHEMLLEPANLNLVKWISK